MKAFSDLTYDDAVKLFGKERRTLTAQTARKYRDGDAWQDERGYIGQLPPPDFPARASIIENLKAGFVSENIVGEVAETHVGGVLGQEPLWWFLKGKDKIENDPLSETLTPWWDEREGLATMADGAETAVLEGIAIFRYYFPKGLLGQDLTIQKPKDIAEALGYFYCEILTADKAGVFTDDKTKKQIGVCLLKEAESDESEAQKRQYAELCYLDDDKKTVLRRVWKDSTTPEDFGPYDLGGRLLVYELRRPALITPAVLSNVRALNLGHTMMMRNVNLAGNRTTHIINAQRPTKPKTEADASGKTREVGREEAAFKSDPGWVNLLGGKPIYNDAGKITGYTNPNVTTTDPVDVTTFVQTVDHYRAAIYGQTFMRHVMISGDAMASGRSREQARKEYERSLQKTKGPLDAAGRWKLETAVRMAAVLSGKEAEVKDLRAYFDCQIERVERSPAERQEDRADVDAGLMSAETAMSRNRIEDTGAEKKKIAKERRKGIGVKRAPTVPMPTEDRTGKGAIA